MFDNLFKNSAPAKTPASGGLFNNLFATPTPAAKPTAIPANSPLAPLTTPATPAAPVTPLVAKPSPNPEASLTPDIPATALTGNLGGGYGTSNITDLPGQTSSNGSPLGKPLLTFINPAAKSSQLLSDRVAPAFDPTVPQKIDPSILENGRMPQSASDAVRKATGAQPDEQLDHLISLEIGGSNQPDNLNLEKLNSSGKQPSLTNENAIAKQVATGQISYIDGQKAIARLKGVILPDDTQGATSPHPLASNYPNPAPNQVGTQSQQPSLASKVGGFFGGLFNKAKSAGSAVVSGVENAAQNAKDAGLSYLAGVPVSTRKQTPSNSLVFNASPDAITALTTGKNAPVPAAGPASPLQFATDLPKTIVQGATRSALAFGKTLLGEDQPSQPGEINASKLSPIEQLSTYGKEPVGPLVDSATVAAARQGNPKALGGLGLAGLGLGANVTLDPGTWGDDTLAKLAQETDVEKIVSTLTAKGVEEDGARSIAPILSRAQTPEQVKAVLQTAAERGIINIGSAKAGTTAADDFAAQQAGKTATEDTTPKALSGPTGSPFDAVAKKTDITVPGNSGPEPVYNVPINELHAHGAPELADVKTHIENGALSKTQGPIEVTQTPSGKITVLDGQHRVAQALSEGKSDIQTTFVPYKDAINPDFGYTAKNLIKADEGVPFVSPSSKNTPAIPSESPLAPLKSPTPPKVPKPVGSPSSEIKPVIPETKISTPQIQEMNAKLQQSLQSRFPDANNNPETLLGKTPQTPTRIYGHLMSSVELRSPKARLPMEDQFKAADEIAKEIGLDTSSVNKPALQFIKEGGGYLTDKTDIGALRSKIGDFSVVVKDVNGNRAMIPSYQYEELTKNKAFTDRIRSVFINPTSVGIQEANADPEFMSKIFKQGETLKLVGDTGQSIEKPNVSKLIGKVKFTGNSTVSKAQISKFVNTISDDRIQNLLLDNGIKNVNVEAPHKFGLSEQGNISPSTKTINISADATDPSHTMLHELGHAKFESLPPAQQQELISRAQNYNDPSMVGYKKLGEWKEIIADSLYTRPDFAPEFYGEEKKILPPNSKGSVANFLDENKPKITTPVDNTIKEDFINRVKETANPTEFEKGGLAKQSIPELWRGKQESLRNADTTNKVSLKITGDTEKERVQSAIVNSERVKNEIALRGQEAVVAGQALKPSDLTLALQYEEGKPIEELAKQSSNPAKFIKFMTKLTDYYDYRLAADRAAGGSTKKVASYLPHNWDLSNPEDLARFNDLAKQKGLQPYDGFRAQPRVFKSYAEGKSLGFVPKNRNVLEDLKQDVNMAKTIIPKQALKQGLIEAAPDKVSTTGYGKSENGKTFINSNVAGLEGMSYDKTIHNQLKGYQPLANEDVFSVAKQKGFDPMKPDTYPELWNAVKESGALNTVGTLWDHGTGAMKTFILNFGGFHSLNISSHMAGVALFNPIKGVKGLTMSIPAFFSEKFTQGVIDSFKTKMVKGKNYSVFDAGMRAGVDLGRNMSPSGFARLNPLTVTSRAIFNREIYTMKLYLTDVVFGNGKINPESPEGRAVAKEINQIMGEVNLHTSNINTTVMKWFRRGMLAPNFTASKYMTLGDAFTKWKGGNAAAGNLARKAVIGNTLIWGIVAAFGTLLLTGEFPKLKQLLFDYSIDPRIQSNLKNPQGTQQDIKPPQTFISEPGSPLSAFWQGNTQPLTNYAMARLSPPLSDALSLYTNKDFYGNPIVNKYSSTPSVIQAATNLGVGDLPIAAQNVIDALNGKMTPTQTAINIAGFHTSNKATPQSVSDLADMIITEKPQLETEIKQDYLSGKEADGLDLINNFDQKLLDKTIQAWKDSGGTITDMNGFINMLNTTTQAKGGLKDVYLKPPSVTVMTNAKKKQGQPLFNKLFPSNIPAQ